VDIRVHGAQRAARGKGFLRADRLGAIEDLALQGGEVDLVGISERQAPDAGGGQVERGGTAEAARTDHQRARGAQLLLPLDPDFREEDVAAVAEKLLVVNSFCWTA